MVEFVTPDSNVTTTTNGQLAFRSTNNGNLDFYAKSGNVKYPTLVADFEKALQENPDVALRNLLNTRDIRSGKGIRENSRTLLKLLAEKYPQLILKTNLLKKFVELGRWDDIFVLSTTSNYTVTQLVVKTVALEFLKPNADNLLLKWLPVNSKRENDKKFLHLVRNYVKMTAKDFRKSVTSRRKNFIPEYKFCTKQWSLLDYSTIPSQCFRKNRNSFKRNDEVRFNTFVEAALTGKTVDGKVAKINASAVWPHEVVGPIVRRGNMFNFELTPITAEIEAQWKNLPDFIPEGVRILPIIDTSGSMATPAYSNFMCIDIAVTLGLYCAEKNKSIYKDAFMTFHDRPTFINLKSVPTLGLRIAETVKAPWGGTTNLGAAFDKLLISAVEAKVSPEDMPTHILIITDGQFNAMTRGYDASDAIKLKYIAAGYEVPKLIFWNVNARVTNFTVEMGTNNTALISGYSPSVVKTVLTANFEQYSPVNIMLADLMDEKYNIEYEVAI